MPRKYPPLPGYTYQGINGESNSPRMLIASGTTLGLAIVAVVLRMIIKWFIVSSAGWEDYFAIAAIFLATGRTVMLIIMAKDHQFGQHIWDIQMSNVAFEYEWAKGATIAYLAAIACTKVSILILYVRLFGINTKFRYICFVLMALVTAYCTAMILGNVFQCRPVHAGWNFFAPGHCASLQKITAATGALNIASDLAIVTAPIPLVLKLQLRPAKMVGILAILATGFFVVAVAIVREVEVVRAPILYDVSWTDATRVTWLSVELHVGIFCACLPLLSPLGRKLPRRDYFRDQYQSAISLIRGSWRRTRASQTLSQDVVWPKSENKTYIERAEPDFGEKNRDLESVSQAGLYGL